MPVQITFVTLSDCPYATIYYKYYYKHVHIDTNGPEQEIGQSHCFLWYALMYRYVWVVAECLVEFACFPLFLCRFPLGAHISLTSKNM